MSDHRTQWLADYLVGAGVLDRTDPWLKGLREVPRHRFVPRRAWAEAADGRPGRVIDRDADPDDWLDAVYGAGAVITQRGDGSADVADRAAPFTSSLSSPHTSVDFLAALDLQGHHRVLEIGTGTGWTAGMLAWRLGDDRVTTVEVDPSVSATAIGNLKSAGFSPTTLVGDGALGAPDGAPWDRVHVTCGIRDVPFTWVEQTRPGGMIVLPYMPPHGQWGLLLRLDVLDDDSAIGRFFSGCRYMMMRSQRRDSWPPYPDDGITRPARLDPRTPWAALDHGFGLALAAAAPHLVITTAGREESGWIMRLRDLRGDGWALVAAQDGETAQVYEGGGRQLWTTLETTYLEWLRAGRPGPGDYRMIVTRHGQDVWLTDSC